MRRALLTLTVGLLLSSMGVVDLRAGSDEPSALNKRGVELLQEGKIDLAIAEFQKALNRDPDYVSARLNLAYILDRQGRIDDAIDQYRSAIERDPNNPIARSNLGVLYDKKGRYEQAIQEFEKGLEIDPTDTAIRKNLEVAGKNKAIVQEREQQIAQAKKEVQSQPKSAIAAYKLGRLYSLYGERELAIDWLSKALKLGYQDVDYLQKDRALDPIRSDPRFTSLIETR